MSAEKVLQLLQVSSCFRGDVCAMLPCACAETIAARIEALAGISDADLWAEWLRRRAALRAKVTREYQREYKRKMRAGIARGKRGMQLMKKYREDRP
jgi:hypothetical protein